MSASPTPGPASGPSVFFASPEITPYAKTGGLGDVLGALPGALAALKVDVSLVMPAYRDVLHGGYPLDDTGWTFTVPVSDRQAEGRVLTAKTRDGLPIYFVRNDGYFDRAGLYGTPEGDFPDNAERFVFFSRAILEVLRRHPPRILQANDWECALAVAFLKAEPALYPELARTKTVMTIHNLGYQGSFWALDWHLLNLDRRFFGPDCLEAFGNINFLKGGIACADAITTVSPTYAGEIKTSEQGFGLEGLFQKRADRLSGILNGVDYRTWDPQTDSHLRRRFSAKDLRGKRACKADLQGSFGLESSPDTPVLGMVTRLTSQKGVDLVEAAFDRLAAGDCQFVLLGSGDRKSQDFFQAAANRYPGRVGVTIGFDEALAHRIIAGADVLLMPSRYEPGGLTHLYGMKYGTVPLVRATGGLKDTVTEFEPSTGRGNGFLFQEYLPDRLLDAVERALAAYRSPRWPALVRNAMLADFSWERSARAYLDVYRDTLSAQ